MSIRRKAACALVALSVGACADQGGGIGGETVGTVGGGAVGALIGSSFGQGAGRLLGTAVGTVAGALAGREIARRLSDEDGRRATGAEDRAVAGNEPSEWTNPETGRRGVVEPTRTYESSSGQTCRDYAHTVYVDGEAETARGTACRQADGNWRLVS